MSLKSYLKNIVKSVLNKNCGKYTIVKVYTTAPNERLKGKNIIVTGGGRGLGYYIAKRSLEEGANVLISGRKEENLKKASMELGVNVKYLTLDVQNVKTFEDFFKEAEILFGGKIDSLVSNAGISLHEENFRNVTENGWDKQMNTNLKGNYFIVSKFVKYLESQEEKSGNIVVITSERAKRPDDIPYGLTKVATSSFIKGIASKVIKDGIRINGVGPGVTASDMTGFDKNKNMYAEWQPQKRIFMPEEVAEVVNFLLSDVSACISGEVITCDQGRYITHW